MFSLSPQPRAVSLLVAGACLALIGAGCQPQPADSDEAAADSPPHVMASSSIEGGRYAIILGGCMDCHTDGWLESQGQVPEDQWLTGWPVGFRGPWGTTYPKNLRLTVQDMTEDQWVVMLRTRNALPPMPWMNVNQISESDARAIYRYIRSLGPAGEPAPAPVPPDQEPTTPYISLVPTAPAGG